MSAFVQNYDVSKLADEQISGRPNLLHHPDVILD